MRKFFGPMGAVSRITVASEVLKNNMLGDPTVRDVDVYMPAGHDGQGLPLLVDLVGFTSSGLSPNNWTGFQENMPERLRRLIGEERMPPVVVAFPDCFTRLGGNQYINSASTGAWEDYLLHEMLPEIEQRFGCGGAGRRGVLGKSSGGYGAITHALRHSDIWSAAACHSGDMGFELCYLPDMPAVSSDIVVSHTLVADNGGTGIEVQPIGADLKVRATLNQVEVYHSGLYGVFFQNHFMSGNSYSGGLVNNTISSYNGNNGV